MKYTVTFKYSTGDKVTLNKFPPYNQVAYNYKRDFSPKEYKVSGCKFFADGDGVKIYYRLYAYCDDYLTYHNWLGESYLDGEGTEHTEEIEFIGINGADLQIWDTVYSSVYYGGKEHHYVDPEFTFAKKGKIHGFVYEKIATFFMDGTKKEETSIQATCDFFFPEKWAHKSTEYTWGLLRDIDENFVEDYVKGCKASRFNPTKEREYDNYTEMLKSMGVYEKVIELYNNRPQSKKKPKTLKIDKIEKKTVVKNCSGYKIAEEVKDMLAGMSEEMKAEMLKQLKKK